MNIAILDDGVQLNNINKDINIDEICGLDGKGYHGTRVINTIAKYVVNEKNSYSIYNIMNGSNMGCTNNIVNSLMDILGGENIKIVVMSLTINENKLTTILEEICKEIIDNNIFIVSSYSNKDIGYNVYPAEFKHIFSVKEGGFVGNKYIYDQSKMYDIVGDILPEFIEVGINRQEIFQGTSKATAKFVSHIIRGIELGADNYKLMEEYLISNSSVQCENILNKIRKSESLYTNNVNKQILDICYKTISEFKIQDKMIPHLKAKEDVVLLKLLKNDKEYDLLFNRLFEILHKQNSILQMSYSDFVTINNFVRYMDRL